MSVSPLPLPLPLPLPYPGDSQTFALWTYVFPELLWEQGEEGVRGLERGKTNLRACHQAKSNRRCCHLSRVNKSRQHQMHNSSLTKANSISISSQTASKWNMILSSLLRKIRQIKQTLHRSFKPHG